MGLELQQCEASIEGENWLGKFYLDSTELLFRSSELRWAVKIGKGTSAKATEGVLMVRRGSKSATFSVGAKAEKWAEKIRNPPTRATKLGLKPQMKVVLRGRFDSDFRNELHENGLVVTRSLKSCDIAFIFASKTSELKALGQVFASCKVGVHVWTVWPKGGDSISQSQVIESGSRQGAGPGKKIAFDSNHTAMRFTKK